MFYRTELGPGFSAASALLWWSPVSCCSSAATAAAAAAVVIVAAAVGSPGAQLSHRKWVSFPMKAAQRTPICLCQTFCRRATSHQAPAFLFPRPLCVRPTPPPPPPPPPPLPPPCPCPFFLLLFFSDSFPLSIQASFLYVWRFLFFLSARPSPPPVLSLSLVYLLFLFSTSSVFGRRRSLGTGMSFRDWLPALSARRRSSLSSWRRRIRRRKRRTVSLLCAGPVKGAGVEVCRWRRENEEPMIRRRRPARPSSDGLVTSFRFVDPGAFFAFPLRRRGLRFYWGLTGFFL